MISPVACLECGKPFRVDKLANCPSCGVVNVRLDKPIQQSQSRISQSLPMSGQTHASPSHSEVDRNTIEIVAAQNRTTHAVRSLAITFVAAPVISLIIAVAFVFAAKTGNAAIIVLSGIVAVIILIGTFVSALDELSLSKVGRLPK
jgi:hypothetical protein